MRQIHQAGPQPRFVAAVSPLPEQVAEALRCRTTPLSHLLRLMAALDAEDQESEALRAQLRARIGAPLDA